MLSQCIRNVVHKISVYQGISPSLLATMSLTQNIKGIDHKTLIQSLEKQNIIRCDLVKKSLMKLDRKLFIKETQKHIYENKPLKISKGQCMTDIFTHAIVLNHAAQHLKSIKLIYQSQQSNINKQQNTNRQIKILDIGTGHGYIAFAIHQIAKNIGFDKVHITAIDCFKQSIHKCNQIKQQLNLQDQNHQIHFQNIDITQFLQTKHQYDFIVAGFFIQPILGNRIQQLLSQSGVGVWPTVSQTGQGLFIFNSNKTKRYILETLFSQQVVRSSVQDYFISDHPDEKEQQSKTEKQFEKQSESAKLNRIKIEISQKKKQLQQMLKCQIQVFQNRISSTKVSLKQLQSDPSICKVLQELKRYK